MSEYVEGIKEIVFRATFPPIMSAFKRSGSGDGLRVQIDIPEVDVDDAIALMALTQCVLEFRVRVLRDGNNERDQVTSRRSAKRRV